jgi:hypothetical protein
MRFSTQIVASGTALTNATAETVLASRTIRANWLNAGASIRISGLVRVTANAGATTLTPRLRIGPTTLTGTALIAGTATDTAVDHIFVCSYLLQVYDAPSATAAVRGMGWYQDLAAVGGAFKTAVLGTGGVGGTLATNGDLLVELTGQWSVADANSCQAEILKVELS